MDDIVLVFLKITEGFASTLVTLSHIYYLKHLKDLEEGSFKTFFFFFFRHCVALSYSPDANGQRKASYQL